SASMLWLLPEPDSPTMPSVSPRSRSNDRRLTAWTSPSGVAKRTSRSLTSRIAMSVLGGNRGLGEIGVRALFSAGEVRFLDHAARKKGLTPISHADSPSTLDAFGSSASPEKGL